MTQPLLQINSLFKHFDGISALDDFSCVLETGECLGLIGPNGAGKTTLFNVISGLIQPDQGNVLLYGEDVVGMSAWRISQLGISRTFQAVRQIQSISVLNNVLLHFKSQLGENILNIFLRPRIVSSFEQKNREVALLILKRCGLEETADKKAGELSYGQQKLLNLACCLASQAKVLLLDEPIAGIAPQMIEKILELIESETNDGKGVFVIEHDLDIIVKACDRLIFMDVGKKACEGLPNEVRKDPRVLSAYIE
jgi:ABC-type branched-subunit amino acid transport system ATPase component